MLLSDFVCIDLFIVDKILNIVNKNIWISVVATCGTTVATRVNF